jgi:zinc protease
MLKNFFAKALMSCFFLGLFSVRSLAQDTNKKLPVDPEVTTGTLSNGLTYYIRPNKKPEQKVELRLVVKAGSILENDAQQGLAHFMEHMEFNGLKNFPKNDLVSFLQSIGVQFGADLNANTGFDRTVYILPIPTDKPGNLENGFQILEDWAHQALLSDSEIDDERHVVLEESRLGKGADDRMMRKYLGDYLAGSHYADRLPIGKDSILKTFKYNTLRDFYHDWYRPDLMAVIVVGDITVPKAMEMIKKHFGAIKNPKNEKARKYYPVPPYSSQKAMVVTDKEASSYQFVLVYSAKKVTPQKTIGDYRDMLVRNIFLQMLNKRYQDLSQSANPPFAYAYTYIGSFAHGYENFQIGAAPTTDIDGTVKAAIGELVKAQKFGFNETELELVKKNMMSSIENMYKEKDKNKSVNYVREYIRAFIDDEPIPGISNEYQYYKEMLPSITLAEVNKEAHKWLDDNKNYFALLTGNGKDLQVPTNQELLATVREAFQQDVTAVKEEKVAEKLLDKEPVPGKIVSSSQDADLGTTTYTLSNGVVVTVKSTDFKSDEIILSGIKKGGYDKYGAADKANAQVGASGGQMGQSLIDAMGYGSFTPTALKNYLAGKTLEVGTSMDGTTDNVSGSSSVKDFETMLQLTYLKLTDPRKDEALAKGAISSQKSQLTFLANNPQVSFIDTLFRVYFHNDPLTPIIIPKASDLDQLDVDRTLEIYKSEFSNADGFNFYIVGNIDENTIKPLIEKYLGGLPVQGATANFKDNGLRPVNGNHVMNFYKGSEPKSLVLGRYYGEVPYSEDLAMRSDLMCNILNIKITEVIREKMSAIYAGGIYADISKTPYNHYALTMQLPCGPKNVDTVLKASAALIKSLREKGPSAEDLQKVKLAKTEKHKEVLKQNHYWADKLERIMFWGDSKQRFLDFDKVVNAISAKDIQETANELFTKNTFIGVMYPEKGTKDQ